MAKRWWNRFGRTQDVRRTRQSPLSRPSCLKLEDRTTPAITLSNVTLTPPGPLNEGGVSTLHGDYTATNIIGALQLQISATAPISFTQPILSPGSGSFDIPITFLDNNTPVGTPVSVNVSLVDTGPNQITNQADAGQYRAFSVPFITNVGLNASLASVGLASGVQTLLISSVSSDNQNGLISLGGNTFTFYGVNVGTQIGVNENGLVTFNGLAPSSANNNTVLTALPNNLGALSPLWTDLVLSPTGRVCFRFVDLDGNAGNGSEYLVIEWANVLHRQGAGTSPSTGTFQVFLQLNTGATTNGDVICNYIDTDFGVASSNFGANATIGIKNLNSANNNFTQIAFNPAPTSQLLNNFQSQHAVRFSSNPITLPVGLGGFDPAGYHAFRMPFESKIDLVAGTTSGQATNVILTGTFDNTTGFQAGAQPFLSSINVGGNAVVTNNTFTFYGNAYNSLSGSKNGLLTFNAVPNPNSAQNGSMNSALAPTQATLAALWDDWNGLAGANAQVLGRFTDFDGNGVPEYLIINWKGVNNGGINPTTANNFATFQAMLQLNTATGNGGIFFNYQDTDVGDATLNNGASATVGIKDVNPTNGRFLDVYVNQPTNDLGSGRAIGLFQLASATVIRPIIINNVPPVLSANPNDILTLDEGGTFTRTISIFDPGILDTFTGSVDFGDGSGPMLIGLLPGGSTQFVISHVYADNGLYTVTVNITDKDGGAAAPFVFTVTVNNVPPTLSVAPGQFIIPGQLLVLNGADPAHPFIGTFTDPGFTPAFGNTMETFVTTIDWGDGVIDTVPPNSANVSQTVVNGSPGVLTTGTIAARHLYGGTGTFNVIVTVTDDDGGATSHTIIIQVGSSNLFVVAADAGGRPLVKVFDSRVNIQTAEFDAYAPSFSGGVRVAVGDITGDGLADVVTSPGQGGGPHIKVFDGANSFAAVREFNAYDPAFRGGVYVAVGDLNGDGRPDIITGAGEGGGPHVRAFSGVDGAILFDGFAYDPNFRGGVRVAIADVNHDGRADIITSPGAGGGPHVKVFSGLNGQVLASFLAYDANFRGGVYVAAGDTNNDGNADVITGPGLGGGPILRVFDVSHGNLILNESAPFPPGGPGGPPFTGNSFWSSGLRVGTLDFNKDGQIDIMVGPGPGQQPRVRIVNGATLGLELDFLAFVSGFLGGVNVAGN